jgi:hypothetical protein
MKTRRWRQTAACLALVGLTALACGCAGDGGAVTVRWRIVELETGKIWDPSDSAIAGSEGFCCHRPPGVRACINPSPDMAGADMAGGASGVDTSIPNWVVKTVEVQLTDANNPLSDDMSVADMGELITTGATTVCTAGELTTKFNLPTGRFAVSLVANATDRSGRPDLRAITPAPEIRDIVAGAVVNLQVIEIAVNPLPLPLPAADAGVTQ